MKMSNKLYDALRWTEIIAVAFGTLYGVLAGAWGLPYGDAMIKTCSGFAAFLAAILKASSSAYWEDKTIITNPEGTEGE